MKPTTVVRILFDDGNKASFATTDADKLLPIIVAAPGWCGLETVIIDPNAPLVEQLREALYPPLPETPFRAAVVGEVWGLVNQPPAGDASPPMVKIVHIDDVRVLVETPDRDPSEGTPGQWAWQHSYLRAHYKFLHIAASSVAVPMPVITPGGVWKRQGVIAPANTPLYVQVTRAFFDDRMVDVAPVNIIKGDVYPTGESVMTWKQEHLIKWYVYRWMAALKP